jgi:amidophosphoribosyltransferase
MAGMIGHGDVFVLRDPSAIRPAFYYYDDEVVVMTSERPAIQTAFDVLAKDVQELERGHVLIVKKDGEISTKPFKDQYARTACSFERIYFSRGTDRDIYQERKKLGKYLVPAALKSVDYNLKNAVFSFIPNTAEVAFFGMAEGLHEWLNEEKARQISKLKELDTQKISEILSVSPRIEKLAVKDEKLRTFIADDSSRGEMVSHVYDVTYGLVENEVDTVVVIDDSIVRGTTLRDSILEIISRLRPRKIVVLSSAPQIRYPDCYGIDMSKMGEFAAFQALVSLIREDDNEKALTEAYKRAKNMEKKKTLHTANVVQSLYELYAYEQISNRISEILRPAKATCEIEIIFQTLDDLHKACPNHNGDWYFSGNYPTPGGNRVVNKSFINFMENKNERAY